MKAVLGGSQRDNKAIHFSYYTKMGLGAERTVAIYFPSTNILEIHPDYAKFISNILRAKRRYEKKRSIEQKPTRIEYW